MGCVGYGWGYGLCGGMGGGKGCVGVWAGVWVGVWAVWGYGGGKGCVRVWAVWAWRGNCSHQCQNVQVLKCAGIKMCRYYVSSTYSILYTVCAEYN